MDSKNLDNPWRQTIIMQSKQEAVDQVTLCCIHLCSSFQAIDQLVFGSSSYLHDMVKFAAEDRRIEGMRTHVSRDYMARAPGIVQIPPPVSTGTYLKQVRLLLALTRTIHINVAWKEASVQGYLFYNVHVAVATSLATCNWKQDVSCQQQYMR